MKNAIFKADEQLQNGFKQIYPNNNNVEINVKSWHDARLIEKTNYQETLSKSFSKPNFRLLFNSFKDDSFKEEYEISKVKFVNEKQEKIEIAYPKKIKKIYVNIEEKSVIIMIDDNFCSKYEKKQTAKMKAKEEFTSNIKDLLN